MGCCASQPATNEPQLTFQRGICVQGDCGEGQQVGVSAAGWMGVVALQELCVASFEGSTATAALFDSSQNRALAQYVAQNLVEALREESRSSLALDSRLRATLKTLQRSFLSSSAIPDKVKSSPVLSGVVVLMDFRQRRAVCARVGNCGAAAGRLVHGLAAQLTEGAFVFRPEDGEGDVATPAEKLGIAPPPVGAQGSHEQPDLEVSTAESELNVIDEQIILGTAGFWALISKDDAVLRSHFMLKAHRPGWGQETLTAPPVHIAADVVQYAANKRGRQPTEITRSGSRDTSALILTLRWPATSINQAFSSRGPSFLESLQHEREQFAGSGARLRWRKVRMMLIEFRRARRKALREKWLQLVTATVAHGRKRAREIEALYWAKHQAVVRVTASGVITDSNGKRLLPTTIPLEVC